MPSDEDPENASASSVEDDADVNEMTDHHDDGSDSAERATAQGNGSASKLSKMKDPLRPRRKKARRACFACQRAHLTCGDERPCQRCIKRGLQDGCQDGVRKKAKYLRDAPDEKLLPGAASHYSRGGMPAGMGPHGRDLDPDEATGPLQRSYFAQNQPMAPAYSMSARRQMPPPIQDLPQFSNRPSPISPTLYSNQSKQSTPIQTFVGNVPQSPSGAPSVGMNPFVSPGYEGDPGWTPFDLAGLNFVNHYGALEFGMLGHMSSGAAETPPENANVPMGFGGPDFSASNPSFSQTASSGPSSMYGQDSMMDWQGSQGQPQPGANAMFNKIGQHMPHAFTIGTGGTPYTSPSSGSSPQQGLVSGYEGSPMNSTFYGNPPNQKQPAGNRARVAQRSRATPPAPFTQPVQGKRSRHPNIYETVKQPYPYTNGFHGLTACIQRRFSPQKTLRIAKSLASIRPSFIACTKTLNREDLIFMEKCFQRTLMEYEDFINACGTPTIVCRRTGEIAAVGKEFSILTGWRKDVLLGREPNMNINTGGSPGLLSRPGLSTPGRALQPEARDASSRPQPVFLADLLDDDSVIEFYEDFAKLAFGDSRGSVTTRCKLLKYRAKEDKVLKTEDGAVIEMPHQDFKPHHRIVSGKNKASVSEGEAGMTGLGARDGKVECSYCWTVKRDVFDIPMLIVMNFLPCI